MTNFLKNKLNKEEKIPQTNTGILYHNKLGEVSTYKDYTTVAEADTCKMNISSTSCQDNEKLLALETNQNLLKYSTATSSSNEQLLKVKDLKSNKNKFVDMCSKTAPQKKAKVLRLEKKQKKLLSQGKTNSEIEALLSEPNEHQNYNKSLEEFFNELNSEKNKLELKLIRVMSDGFLKTLDESANLYKKYQMAIHKDDPEDCDKSSFFKFLVKSPLQEWCPENGPLQGYGSYHDQYWLNGKLIAVGVIDILPSCISSVYFFYDPVYSHLSLGTFSSLREIFLTRQLSKTVPNLKYYYMGFYIHTCPKMRYKSKMVPSKLLCPESYVWCDIEKCLLKLEINKYSRLNEDLEATDQDGIINLNEVLLLYREQAMLYKTYKRMLPTVGDEHQVSEYAALVGMKCATSILLYRNS